jgi:hypothetical protein
VPFAIPKSSENYCFLRHSICEVSSSEKQGCLQRKLLVPPKEIEFVSSIPLSKHAVLDLVVLKQVSSTFLTVNFCREQKLDLGVMAKIKDESRIVFTTDRTCLTGLWCTNPVKIKKYLEWCKPGNILTRLSQFPGL